MSIETNVKKTFDITSTIIHRPLYIDHYTSTIIRHLLIFFDLNVPDFGFFLLTAVSLQ